MLVGWLVNQAVSLWGSWGIAVLHVGGLAVALAGVGRNSVTIRTAAGPNIGKRIGEIRAAFAPAIGSTIVGFSTAEIRNDDGTWSDWRDLPIRLKLDSGRVISVSWSRFDDLWIATGESLPFDPEATTHRWMRDSIATLRPVVGGVIKSAMLGQGGMSIEEREIEIWTRLLIETDRGWLEIYNALDENGYQFYAERPEGNFVRCTGRAVPYTIDGSF